MTFFFRWLKHSTVQFTTTEFPNRFPPHPHPVVAQVPRRHSTVTAVRPKSVAVAAQEATDANRDRRAKEKLESFVAGRKKWPEKEAWLNRYTVNI